MRFLQRSASRGSAATHDFTLVEFDAAHIPHEYAVLSHRWGEQEVTFRDFGNGTASSKAGYQKLQFCAERAAYDGISYFWIDTCCIDKSSSAELSEAINSMYKWYRNATKCYVYMLDVCVIDCNGVRLVEEQWQAAFRNSVWFTRGWTLQELIAPTKVEFFSAEARWLGDKSSLEQLIHDITGVPVEALRGYVSRFDIKERLSWASERVTTLEEDGVYCTLGIADVVMPLLYGEGRQNAAARLQREVQIMIRSASETQSSVAHSTGEGHSIVPRSPNPQTPAPAVTDWEGFLTSLSYPEMEYRYHNVGDAHDDTCSWLLNHNSYQKWIRQAESSLLLMIRGKPGSGKSTAMKRAYTIAREKACENEAIVGFFFNSRGVAMESRLEGFFRSTLHQLLQSRQCADDESFSEYNRKNSSIRSGWTWTVQELRKMFVRCIKHSTAKITMFVDALDECDSTSSARELMGVLTSLLTGCDLRHSRPRICVSCRHYPNIGIAEPLQITVERVNRDDIVKYARTTLQQLVTEYEDLLNTITSRSQGVFLWAFLVLEKVRAAVEDGEPRRTLRSVIDAVPRRLEELFQELLDSTPVDQREQRNLILLWTLFAQRPLSLSELNDALAFKFEYGTYLQYEHSDDFVRPEQMKRILASRTRGLVEVVEVQEWKPGTSRRIPALRVQFIHESVRQYLLSQRDPFSHEQGTVGSVTGFAHSAMAFSCFNYVKAVCIEREVVEDALAQSWMGGLSYESLHTPTRPLLDYATRFGFQHASTAEADGRPQSYLFEESTSHNQNSLAWWEPFTRIFRLYQRRDLYQYDLSQGITFEHWSDHTTSLLAFANVFDLHSLVNSLLTKPHPSPSEWDLSMALCATIIEGHTQGLTTLIQAGAGVNFEHPTLGSPLCLSIVGNRPDIIGLLVKHGTSVHMGPRLRSPLVIAAEKASADVVRLLIHHGANVAECERRQEISMSSLGRHGLEAAALRDSEILDVLLAAAEHEKLDVEYYKIAFLSAKVFQSTRNVKSLRSAISRLHPDHTPLTLTVNKFSGRRLHTYEVEVWSSTTVAILKIMLAHMDHSSYEWFILVTTTDNRILRDDQLVCAYVSGPGETIDMLPMPKAVRWLGFDRG